jgi:hypothetical protein
MSLMDFMVFPPGCGRNVTNSEDGTPMRWSYVVPMRWMVIYEYEVPGGALNLSLLNYPTMVTMGIFPFKEKSPCFNRESNPGPHDQ